MTRLFHLILAAVSFTFIVTKNCFKTQRTICERELEAIIYSPKTCTYEYLKSVNNVLKEKSYLFWHDLPALRSLINQIYVNYGVSVYYYNAMGIVVKDDPSTTGLIIPAGARSYALGEGYMVRSEIVPVGIYISTYWNPDRDGQMYTVALYVNIGNVLEIC